MVLMLQLYMKFLLAFFGKRVTVGLVMVKQMSYEKV